MQPFSNYDLDFCEKRDIKHEKRFEECPFEKPHLNIFPFSSFISRSTNE